MANWRELQAAICLALAAAIGGADARGAGSIAEQRDKAARVAIVANSSSPESVWLAKRYAKKRGIPAKNILYIRTASTRSISWTKFVEEIFNPLRLQLVEGGWIAGEVLDETDPHGRRRIVANAHRIAFLVTTFHVPFIVNNDASRVEIDKARPHNKIEQAYISTAALDTELALLALDDTPAISVVANPLYEQTDNKESARGVIRVSRLDGASEELAARIVDDCMQVEMRGLRGRAFVDAGGPYPQGEGWMKGVIGTVQELGFDLETDHKRSLAGLEKRFDGLALYFGWHSPQIVGGIGESSARIMPGGIGFHIYSYSGDIRGGHWSGQLLKKGAAITVGNVTEPYLPFTHNPEILIDRLAQGWLAGDALMCSLPVLSWQAMHVGDPLYLPFLVEADEALAVHRREDPNLRGYAVVRQMNLLAAAGRAEEAARLGAEAFGEEASLPLAARLLSEAARLPDRKRTLDAACDFLAEIKRFETVELAVGLAAARAAQSEAGRPDAALAMARRLAKAAEPLGKVPIRRQVAEFGAEIARLLGDDRLLAECQAYLDGLVAAASD